MCSSLLSPLRVRCMVFVASLILYLAHLAAELLLKNCEDIYYPNKSECCQYWENI